MKTTLKRRNWLRYAVLSGAFLLLLGGAYLLMPKAQATIEIGDPGPGGSGGTNGHHTVHGHGWTVYTVGGAGPSGGFNDGSSWASVSSRCAAIGANKVWAYAIRNSSGSEKIYTFTNTYEEYRDNFNPDNNTGGANYYPTKPWWLDRPGVGNDPYVYNANGVYDGIERTGGATGYGTADTVVSAVRGIYQKEGGDWNIWGWNVGWFCWHDLDYKLTPTITVAPRTAEAGTQVTFDPIKVRNDGQTAAAGTTKWVVTTFTLASGAAIPGGGLDPRSPTVFYGHGAVSPAGLSGTYAFPKGEHKNWLGAQTLPEVSVGTRVCYTLSVQQYTQTDTRWNHSAPSCVIIAKRPKVQVLGGDLLVGRGSVSNIARTSTVDTSVTTKSGVSYGSWVEYGLVPSGTVKGMASGSGYAGGVSSSCNPPSVLTFTSGTTGGTGCSALGNYVHSTIVPNIALRFPIHKAADDMSPGQADPPELPSTSLALTNLAGSYQAPAGATNLTITESTVSKGRQIIINASGATVTIAGNIRYTTETLRSSADIPQVVLIAKNIIIADHVRQVDAWLMAIGSQSDGRLNTCGAGNVTETSALTHLRCAQKLTINGPVAANHLILRRTAGADMGRGAGNPAEVFNLRGDAYLWAAEYNRDSRRLPTVSTIELPPRY